MNDNDDVAGSDNDDAPVNFMCSRCYTPTPAANSHVIPNWNPNLGTILTTYRCDDCWIPSLDETRGVIRARGTEVVKSFCEFMNRQNFDTTPLLDAPIGGAEEMMLKILDACQEQRVIFHP